MNKMILAGLVCAVALATCVAFGAEPIKMPLPDGVKIIDVGASAQIKTLEVALNYVAEIRKVDKVTPLALRLAPGDYTPGKSLRFKTAHASPDMAPLFVYAADFSKKPRIQGGLPIKNWQRMKFNGRDDVWCADVSTLNIKELPFTLCVNGKRYRYARWPNLDPAYPYTSGYTPADVRRISQENPLEGFYTDELQIRPEDDRKWKCPVNGRVVVRPRNGYGRSVLGIREIKDGVMYLNNDHNEITNSLMLWNCWYVENIAEELDIPGEWYYDMLAKKIYLIPLEDVDLNKSVVTVVGAGAIIRFDNSGNCTLAGLEIVGGSIDICESPYTTICACSIHDNGRSGIWMFSNFIKVTDCDIYNCGSSAIFVHSYGGLFTGRNGVILENNYIHHCGGIFNAGQGTRISHNLIHDMLGSAISGYGGFCDISYNRIRHTCIKSNDMGALYDSGWGAGCKTKIRYNWISDTIGCKYSGHNGGTYSFGYNTVCGIYFDETSGGADVYGNLVVRAHWAGMHFHCGRWVNVYNNIFVSNGAITTDIYSCQLSMTNWVRKDRKLTGLHLDEYNHMIKAEPRLAQFPSFSQDANTEEIFADDNSMMMGNKFHGNIFYYPDQAGQGKMLSANILNLKENSFNKNVYWPGYNKKGKVNDVLMHNGRKEGMSSQSWVAAGQDVDSIVADPLFVDPSKDDYRLRSGSPALQLGFVELPFDRMGLQKTYFRPELPEEVEGLREHPEWLKMPGKK